MLSANDLKRIRTALTGLLVHSDAAHMKYANLEHAMQYIEQASLAGKAHVVSDVFVMFDIGSDWYSKELYMIEQLVLKLSKYGDVPKAVAFMDNMARVFGVKAIAAGDTQVGAMTPHYIQAGYKVLGTQFIKEL